jgi:hypothetical protein
MYISLDVYVSSYGSDLLQSLAAGRDQELPY